MDNLLLTILNMSLTGAFVIAVICVARLPLKKAPKIISYCLWAVAGFRLVFPYSFESVFSLIPFKAQTIPPDIAMQPIPRIDSGIPFVNNAVSGILPAATPTASVNPLQIWTAIGAWIWIVGVAVLLIYGVVSFLILKRKMSEAAHIEANIFEAENIKSPFVLGVFKPRIYLPVGLSEQEKGYIILHEQTHIKRHDHIVKFAAYFILCLHWFNPLAWAAFWLCGVDMEMSCDERVLKEMGGETKKDYSLSLLSLATERRMIGGSPLAFGEGGVKERIKNVLNFKKPSRVIITAAVAFVALLSIGFAVNRIVNEPLIEMKMVYEENPAFFFKDMTLVWDDTVYYVTPMNNAGQGKEIGYATDEYSTWRIYELNGYNRDYLLAVESEDVWRVMSIYPLNNPLQQYILENATEKQKMERMLSVTLYNDGTARLATPLISSYALLSPYYYTFTDNELLIHYKDEEAFATFTIYDDDTIVFKSATVPLFADEGARYVSVLFLAVPSKTYEPRKWLDYYNPRDDGSIPYDRSLELELPEFPDTVFSWTAYEVKAINASGARVLFDGWPIHNVFLTDLNGDELPELCATVSIGFGLIDTRVIVYDYANGKGYDLSDRMYYDYSLSIDDGQLVVTQTRYSENGSQAIGSMAIIDGELVVFGIDRTLPKIEPRETTPPADTSFLSSWKPLHELPADYSKEQAIADGVYVNIHGSDIYNQALVDNFYTDVFAGSAAFMRVMQYTIEGDAIITDYQYDGKIFTINYDSTRDKYMGSEGRTISTMTFKYLVPSGSSQPISVQEPYYLSNEENIFIRTVDGEEATLIDGLWWIPTPSDNANTR